MAEGGAVHVFAYLDHRALLRDLFAERKATVRGFSHRSFARRAGLRSTNYLKLVMDGKRNLSAEMAPRFAAGFSLARAESAYFCDLVSFNRAQTEDERAHAHERLMRHRRHREMRQLDAEQARYYERWYVPVIRELVRAPAFREESKWIARALGSLITPAQAREALRILVDLGLLTRDSKGRLRQTDGVVTAGAGPLGKHVVSYHCAMLDRAKHAIAHVSRDEREIASITVCTSQAAMLELKRRMAEMRAEWLDFAERHGPPERVVQLNLQLFPLSQRCEAEDGMQKG
jgi:uncharacterized protein (TIGR02147 family)